MDLYSGIPYWIAKNELSEYFNPLKESVETRVAVIGAGITGSLVANELCRAGIKCCVVDKRTPGTGSSCASTALLQYEIDIPLVRMKELMPEGDAVQAFEACLQAITDLETMLLQEGVDGSFTRVPSLYYASNAKGAELIREEYEMRLKHNLPVEYLSRKALRELTGIKARNALMNNASGQVDAYKTSLGLLAHNMRTRDLKLYTHTEITGWEKRAGGYRLTSAEGHFIDCDYVIVAAGFEAGPFLDRKLMNLTSTFAIVSQPVDPQMLWYKRSLVWETREPYIYIRTDDNNRIIVGGEDIGLNSPKARKFLLAQKASVLERKFKKLFPDVPFVTEMAWSGTFSSTKDGLPIIGAFAEDPAMLYALGYGGNGITFSVVAAQVLTAAVQGKRDHRARIFSPERESIG